MYIYKYKYFIDIPDSYPVGTRGSLLGVKLPRSRMSGAIPPLPQYASWRGAQLKHRDNFTFTFIDIHCQSVTFSSNALLIIIIIIIIIIFIIYSTNSFVYGLDRVFSSCLFL
jgi:hypothetical protein